MQGTKLKKLLCYATKKLSIGHMINENQLVVLQGNDFEYKKESILYEDFGTLSLPGFR